MASQPRRLPEVRAIETPAPAGWRIAAMTALYLVSLGLVGVVAFVGAVRWYVAGFAHLPLWIGSGPLALITGTYADLARAPLASSSFW